MGLGTPPSFARELRQKEQVTGDLTSASLEDLMDIKVTSVSKKEQRLSKVAAAIYVISQDEIRSSGATNIPDLLRMVPGINVAQIDANAWAISARGFNDQFSNKLLVLMDGRSVYDPMFSGVLWDQQWIPLEDIDRIEVIRGPGGTMWGANAVNGVINIITKSSKETQGGVVKAGAGSNEARGLVQYGGRWGGRGTYRVFTGYQNIGRYVNATDQPAADDWHAGFVGFRSDLELSNRDALMLEGHLLSGLEGQTITSFVSVVPPADRTFNDRVRPGGGSILGRWTRTFSPRSDIALQAYFDSINRTEFGGVELWQTVDLDFQHHIALGSRHDVVWGLEFRNTNSRFRPGYAIALIPAQRSQRLWSAFLQDEIALTDNLHLTVGSKLEHNSFTGSEAEPSARLAWTPTRRQTIWGAVSQAIRQPTPSDADVFYNATAFPGPGGLPALVKLLGNPHFLSEKLVAYELGYRVQPAGRISLDFAAFYNVYERLRTTEPGLPYLTVVPPPLHILIPQTFGNNMDGASYGAEVSADWEVSKRWKVSGGYSWLKMNLALDPSSLDRQSTAAVGYSPRHQFNVVSRLTLPRSFEFDTSAYFVGRLPSAQIPSYTRVDARLGWRATESMDLSLVGQNLLDDHHFEFNAVVNPTVSTQIKRSVYAELTWRF